MQLIHDSFNILVNIALSSFGVRWLATAFQNAWEVR